VIHPRSGSLVSAQQQQYPVYQTISKPTDSSVNSGVNKIKNQFVPKSGHLMNQSYLKDVERQTNNLSTAYQSESYQQNGKHRDISSYSSNSQYTQLTSKVGGQLKQNSSGAIMMQVSGPQATGGIPAFI